MVALLFIRVLSNDAGAATPIKIESSQNILDPGDTERNRFDRLIYVSGIAMRSDNADFGGLSGLQISADGQHILAITDAGYWLSADLQFDKGRLSGLVNVMLSPLAGEDGRPLQGKADMDAEALTAGQKGDLSGAFYVSFERNHRVLAYARGLGDSAPARLRMPSDLAAAPDNDGIEALGRLNDGRFIALTEGLPDLAGNHQGWLIGESAAQPISLLRKDIFAPTDLALLPNGDLLVLERRYTVMGGPGMQIRRIPAASILPGAILDGEVLINLAAKHGIDNMEGLAAHQNAAGEIIIYVISDNNFNMLQKNLLLMFKLPAP